MAIIAIFLFASSFLFVTVKPSSASQGQTTTTAGGQVAYLLAEDSPGGRISVVSQSGAYSVIYDYQDYNPGSVYPDEVVADSAGHLIVAECGMESLTRITLPNTLTDIADFPTGSCPASVVIDSAGNYIVALAMGDELVKVTPAGAVTVLHYFSSIGTDCGTTGWGNPFRIAIDSSGNYIVTECAADRLSKVTPAGAYSVIYNFTKGTSPSGVAIDSSGNYIVTECGTPTISKITPSGERTVVYEYPAETPSCLVHGDLGLAIDPSGNYIVAEYLESTLSRITPDGVRTPIFTIPTSKYDTTQHPDSVEVVNASLFGTTTSTSTSTRSISTPSTSETVSSGSAASGGSTDYAMYAIVGSGVAVVAIAAYFIYLRRH
jgi:streptogramin lyase